jgi:membrane protease YdiL (CAAX protease family)
MVELIPNDKRTIWRDLFLLAAIIIGASLIGSLIAILWFGMIDPADLSKTNMNDLRGFLFISHFFTFLVPSLVFAFMKFGSGGLSVFQFKSDLSFQKFVFAFLLLIVSLPWIQFTFSLNQKIPLPDWLQVMEEQANNTLDLMIQMENPTHLIMNLLIMALLPAFGEEMLFRGLIQQYAYKIFRSAHTAIWATAILFSCIHFQFEGFIPRMILGALLGYIFYWTSNIWVPVLIHLLNNGMMVLAAYFLPEGTWTDGTEPMGEMPWFVLIIALGFAVVLINKLMKPDTNSFIDNQT